MNRAAPDVYSFPAYLSAKKSVDERAINQPVWDSLAQTLPASSREQPLRILEVGCGIGAMLERMLDRGLFSCADYLGIDAMPENITFARQSIQSWAQTHGWLTTEKENGIEINRDKKWICVYFEVWDLFDFIANSGVASQPYDLLVAHAFLDLLDIPAILPRLFSLLRPGGLYYFPINFDGVTILEPIMDLELDEKIINAYHQSMDARLTHGRPSGDSQTGRHLFQTLPKYGASILAAGSSDWVVFALQGVYPAEEACFLHFILHFFENTLGSQPGLDQDRFLHWLKDRHAQVERGELVYMAHQLDFVGYIQNKET